MRRWTLTSEKHLRAFALTVRMRWDRISMRGQRFIGVGVWAKQHNQHQCRHHPHQHHLPQQHQQRYHKPDQPTPHPTQPHFHNLTPRTPSPSTPKPRTSRRTKVLHQTSPPRHSYIHHVPSPIPPASQHRKLHTQAVCLKVESASNLLALPK